MTATMNWNDLNFTAADVIKLIIALITGILFVSTINNNINNLGDSVGEIRASQIDFQKEYKVEKAVMQSQINTLISDQKILNLRIEMLEKK